MQFLRASSLLCLYLLIITLGERAGSQMSHDANIEARDSWSGTGVDCIECDTSDMVPCVESACPQNYTCAYHPRTCRTCARMSCEACPLPVCPPCPFNQYCAIMPATDHHCAEAFCRKLPCITCPDVEPICPECPDGLVCIMKHASCQECASAKCVEAVANWISYTADEMRSDG